MDTNSDAFSQAILQDNSAECNALRSLLLGLCQQCSISLQKANSYQELILDELDAHRGNTEYLGMVEKELSTIQALVAQILNELPPAEGERVPLARLADGVLDRYRKSLPATRRITVDLPPEIHVSVDLFEFQELLLNLLNGLDRLNTANPLNWRLALSTRSFSRQEASLLQLKDAGEYCLLSLLPEEVGSLDIKNLRPFAQCLGTATEIPPMVIAQWCGSARHNNAHLLFDTSHPHQSAVLILPPRKRDEGHDQAMEQFRWQNTAPSKTILLVDDEDMIWDVLSDMLQELGYRVILAGDGQEAIQIYGSNPGQIDLVILDMLMPNMGGRETFFILKELDPHVKVLASRGYVSQEEIQDVMDSGAAGFLRKPYHLADLAKKIQEIFDSRK
ncbi:MAG: response regulator [Lentisphaeria bacterium]|nr:response regulator [Lentisphaeria bacterium]